MKFNYLGEFLDWAGEAFEQAELFYGHGTNNSWDEAVAIALHVLELPPDVSDDALNYALNEEQCTQLIQLAELRIETHKPLPYLLNYAWFGGEKFHVDERVIIPRSPFVELIAKQFQPHLKQQPRTILDLCTGSGCIAIACHWAFPDAQVTGADISQDAIDVAEKNIQLHDCAQNVNIVQSDIFSNIDERFDLIVTNPPYIGSREIDQLPDEYGFEPRLALHSNQDGMEIPRQILLQASDYLTEKGLLFLEVGNNWKKLEKTFPQVKFNWLDFKHGGEGICVVTGQQLMELT